MRNHSLTFCGSSIFVKKIVFTSLVFAFLLSGCSNHETRGQTNLAPRVYSALRPIALNSLEDDALFAGNWGGCEFDSRSYRALSAPGGSISFNMVEIEALLLNIEVRPENDFTASFFINQAEFKQIRLKKRTPGKFSFLIPRRLLQEGRNTLNIGLPSNSRIRFYKIGFLPARYKNSLSKYADDLSVTRFTLPARLVYMVGPEDRELKLRFSEPVDRMRIKFSQGKKIFADRTLTSSDSLAVKLHKSDADFYRVTIDLKGRPGQQISLLQTVLFSKSREQVLPADAGNFSKFKDMNLILILLDSARMDHFSCYGYARKTTPSIDQLASRSLVFTNAWAEAAYTLASTATLFSGLAPDYHNAVSNYYGGLNHKIETMAEVIQKTGRPTHAISAIPYCGRSFNMDQGFSEFRELFLEEPQTDAARFIPHLKSIIAGHHKEKKPFFAYFHIREPHIDYITKPPIFGTFQKEYPYEKKDALAGRLKELYFSKPGSKQAELTARDIQLLRDCYDENLLAADTAIGEMVTVLKKHRLFTNTAIIILGDHGEGLYEHGQIGHNTVIYPEGLHIPMIIHAPGITDRQINLDFPVRTSDLTAFILKYFAGNSNSKTFENRGLFCKRPVPLIISRTIFFSGFYPAYALRQYQYDMHIYFPLSRNFSLLFNRSTDPVRMHPVKNPAVAEYFEFRLSNFFKQKRLHRFDPTSSSLKPDEIRSLKSLGYL